MKRRLSEHGSCFVCGAQNPRGMGVVWYADAEGVIRADVVLTVAQQGPPNLAHGGASAALLDEAMGAAVWRAGYRVAAVNLNIQYHKPVPLGVNVRVIGKISRSEGKRIFTQGTIELPDGTLAVSGDGVYVQAEHLFTELFLEKDRHLGES